MTRNQIDWQNMLISGHRQKEEARHNIVTETELRRSNLAREDLTQQEIENKINVLKESQRSNRMNEWLTDFRNQETKRHNEMSEMNDALNIAYQHMDRQAVNAVQKSYNDLSLAIRDLERSDKLYLGKANLDVEDNKRINNYEVALKNLEATWAKYNLDAALNDARLSNIKADTFGKYAKGGRDIAGGVKDVAGIFSLVK